MEIKTFLKDCHQQGILLELKNGELSYSAKKGAMTKEMFIAIKKRKSEIIYYLSNVPCYPSDFKLTSASRSRAKLFYRYIWKDFSSRIDTGAYPNIAIRIHSMINADLLRDSIKNLLQRQSILNSAIELSEGTLFLVQRTNLPLSYNEIAVEGGTIREKEDNARKIAYDLVWKEYNLDSGPLYRIFLLKLSSADNIIGVGLHHAISDAISMRIVLNDLMAIYSTKLGNVPLTLPTIKISYMDYLFSIDSWLKTPGGKASFSYWVENFKLSPTTHIDLKTELLVNDSGYPSSAEETISFNNELTKDIRKMAIQLKTTLFRLILAAHNLAIWKMNNQRDIIVLVIEAGRIKNNIMPAIGNFASVIAYKTTLKGNQSFKEIVANVSKSFSFEASHQPIPLDLIIDKLSQKGITFNAPLIDIFKENKDNKQNTYRLQQFYIPMHDKPHFKPYYHSYWINIFEKKKEIKIVLRYRTDFYDKSIVEKFLEHIQKALLLGIKSPKKKMYDF